MTGKYFDKIDHADLGMKYWDTQMKNRHNKCCLKEIKKDLRYYKKL